jgi:alpha-galactosidase
MGWSSWYSYGGAVTQVDMEKAFEAMTDRSLSSDGTSLHDHGYVHAKLDDGWQACRSGVDNGFHDEHGTPLVNTTKFPDMSAMTRRARARGLVPEFYVNNYICHEGQPKTAARYDTVMRGSAAFLFDTGFGGVKIDSGGPYMICSAGPSCFATLRSTSPPSTACRCGWRTATREGSPRTRCMIGLPLRAVRTHKRRRKAAELQRTSEAGSTDDDEEKLWVGFNEYAVVGGLAAFCVSAYCTPTGGGWKRLRGGSSFVPIEARRRDTTVKAVTQRPTRTPSVTMSDEADDESDTAPVNAAEALQDRLDKTGLVPTEPQGFDGDGFGGYLLPYAGGLILTLLLTSAAFSALVLGSGSAPK